jgi:hypothetical protein
VDDSLHLSRINNLPDGAFLYIEPGGSRDSEGRTTPRTLRHFPYRDASGAVDLPHLRNALSRIPQSNLPADVKARLTRKAQRILQAQGGEAASSEGDTTMSEELKVIATTLGLAEDADPEEVAEAAKVTAAKATALAERVAELEADSSEIEKLRAEVVAERELRITNERAELLARAVRERRITPAQSEVLAEQFGSNLDGLKAVIEATPEGTFAARGSGEAGEDEPDLEAARARLSYRSSAGEFEASDESLELHLEAEKILAASGKKPGHYSEAEYREALLEARGVAA